MTDADTIREADGLWKLVRMVQETIDKDGRPLVVDIPDGSRFPPLAALRALADELDPENGRY